MFFFFKKIKKGQKKEMGKKVPETVNQNPDQKPQNRHRKTATERANHAPPCSVRD
jgi:hypothetical protein